MQKTSRKLGEARTLCEMKTQAIRWTPQGRRRWRGGDPCAAVHTDSIRALVSQRRPGPLEHQEIGTGREACLRRRRGRRLRFVSSMARSVPAERTGGPPAIFIQGVIEGKIKRVVPSKLVRNLILTRFPLDKPAPPARVNPFAQPAFPQRVYAAA